jgi:hypothetical protein
MSGERAMMALAIGFAVVLALAAVLVGVSNHRECRRAGFSVLYCLSSR